MPRFSYSAQFFRPREGAKPLLLFVAPAGSIQQWAGVPRKAFDYLNGFQRTLDDKRIGEVAAFYEEDLRNISPTAVVIGLGSSVKVTSLLDAADNLRDVTVEIEMPEYSSYSISQLAEETAALLESRLPTETVDAIRNRPVEAAIEAEVISTDTFLELGDDDDETVEQTDRSYLDAFYAQTLSQINGNSPWPADLAALREVFYSFLKPAIIVDGQHRVFGAAQFDRDMKLAVCAIPDSNWAENVYQFVVINQKAKPIRPAFLASIIATSLSQSELTEVYDRLTVSDVDITRSQIMDRINTDKNSPFRDMIDFEVPGNGGFLGFPGMWRLASDFRRLSRSYPALLPRGWVRADSDDDDVWLMYFFGFWTGVRAAFLIQDERLWDEQTEAFTNNLLKIVALQEVQRLTLEIWADTRFSRVFESPQRTEEEAQQFWSDFPAAFFTDEWKSKGLQTQVGRGILQRALIETRRKHGTKSWTYRRMELFTGG